MSIKFRRGISYNWSGPNNFNSTAQNPVIENVSSVNEGFYNVTITTEDMCSKTLVL